MALALVISVIGVLVVLIVMTVVVLGVEVQHRVLSTAHPRAPLPSPSGETEIAKKHQLALIAAVVHLSQRERQFEVLEVERESLPSWRATVE